jgi:hypothetical protein
LKIDHGITFFPQRMTQTKTLRRDAVKQQLKDAIDK